MKRALVLMAHGSPDESANRDMLNVAEAIRKRRDYEIVEAGFLECNRPDIPTAIQECVNQGADLIVGVPYFLHTGKHVADDIPALFESAQAMHPGILFRLSDFLGRSSRITTLLAQRANGARM